MSKAPWQIQKFAALTNQGDPKSKLQSAPRERQLMEQTDELRHHVDLIYNHHGLDTDQAKTTNLSNDHWKRYCECWEKWCRIPQVELAARLAQSIRVPFKLPVVEKELSSLFPANKSIRPTTRSLLIIPFSRKFFRPSAVRAASFMRALVGACRRTLISPILRKIQFQAPCF